VEHYRKRGTFEDRYGEFNAVIGPGLPAGSFEANETALLLKLLAFNLAGMIRGELEDASGNGWDLRRVQQTVLKAGARMTEHSRRIFVDVAKAASAAAGLGRGCPRQATPTCAWCCGNDSRTCLPAGRHPGAGRFPGPSGRWG